MTTIRVSSKGQITLPADMRERLDIKPGSQVDLEVHENEIVIRRSKPISELYGIFHEAVKGKSVDWEVARTETERIIAEQVAKEGLE